MRGLSDAMEAFASGGVYVNYLGQESDEGSARVKDAYGSETYRRLVALKGKYDPSNLFRLNQNIKPTGEGRGPAKPARTQPERRRYD